MGIDETLSKSDLSSLKVTDPNGLYQIDNYRISESIGYLIKRVMAVVSTALDQELAQYDITHQQFSILMILSETNCSTAADIARVTCGDTGAMTRMLDRLEAKDIVRRVRSSADRRVVNIELTEAGRVFAAKMPIVAINVMNRYLQGFEAGELEQTKSFMRRLLTNAGVPIVPAATDTTAAPTIE
ncbi:MAG TPA: MarR family transcriptional regulator [Spongiibacteraceae bacterium]|nr:MarR family transcriptional regulator [Spongiibacteraceae bacterium]